MDCTGNKSKYLLDGPPAFLSSDGHITSGRLIGTLMSFSQMYAEGENGGGDQWCPIGFRRR